MKIQYISDLHLEFSQNNNFLMKSPIKPKGDILILAGDIVLFSKLDNHLDFFNYCSDNFKFTYWVPGNHEYYHSDVCLPLSKVNKTGILNEKIKDNVFLINNVAIKHDNIKFIFSTLWTKINPTNQFWIERSMSDFIVIKYNGDYFNINHCNDLHDKSISFIKTELEEKDFTGKIIVATHHVPTILNYPPKYKGDLLNEAFAVELHDFILDSKINYWIYGHHHANITPFKIGKTKLITNQLGYVHCRECEFSNKIITVK